VGLYQAAPPSGVPNIPSSPQDSVPGTPHTDKEPMPGGPSDNAKPPFDIPPPFNEPQSSPPELACRRSSAKTKRARTGTVCILICSGIALWSGASIVVCQWAISSTCSGMRLWRLRAYTLRPARTTDDRRICGPGCRISFQERCLENLAGYTH
jgi:hypothetical protein